MQTARPVCHVESPLRPKHSRRVLWTRGDADLYPSLKKCLSFSFFLFLIGLFAEYSVGADPLEFTL